MTGCKHGTEHKHLVSSVLSCETTRNLTELSTDNYAGSWLFSILPGVMIKLETILATLYADQQGKELAEWLESNKLLEPIKRTVSQLNLHILNQDSLIKECKTLPVGHIASNLLVVINSRISLEHDHDKAKILENTLSDIAVAILTQLFDYIQQKKTVSVQIMLALKDTCELFNYDYSQLIRFLKMDQHLSYLSSMKHSEKAAGVQSIPSFIWKGKQTHKAEFINMLSERKLFLKKKGLQILFAKPDRCLDLCYNPTQVNLTLQFFSFLKKGKLLTFTGCDGFYQVLAYHIKDFEKIFLNNLEAGTRLNALKQSKTVWNDNQQRIEKWLIPFS